MMIITKILLMNPSRNNEKRKKVSQTFEKLCKKNGGEVEPSPVRANINITDVFIQNVDVIIGNDRNFDGLRSEIRMKNIHAER
jgi:hypothetical protein